MYIDTKSTRKYQSMTNSEGNSLNKNSKSMRKKTRISSQWTSLRRLLKMRLR
jgi:hypothetical protein